MWELLLSSSVLKVLLPILGAVGALLFAYFKGKQSANRTHQIEKAKAEKELRDDISTAERKNKTLEEKRRDDETKVRSVKSIADLVRLFREKFSRKT